MDKEKLNMTDIVNFWKKIIIEIASLLKKIKVNIESDRNRRITISYCKVLELIFACAANFEDNIISSIPIILRSALELEVDIQNLVNDHEYIEALRLNDNDQMRKFINELKKDNIYMTKIKEEIKIDEIKSEDCKSLSIKNKFYKANRLDEYSSVYHQLCQDSHSNEISLNERYLNFTTEGIYPVCFKIADTTIGWHHLTLSLKILINATKNIHGHFHSNELDKIVSINDEFQKFIEQYQIENRK